MWRNYAKNILLIFFTAAILLTAPAVTFLVRGEFLKGSLVLFAAALLGIASFSIASYWHERGIHATSSGFVAALFFFALGLVWLWLHGFYFWIPLALQVALVGWGYITKRN